MNNLAMGRRGKGGWDYYETLGGGMGASSDCNGRSARHSHMTNTLNTPVEVLEMNFPVRLTRYRLRDGVFEDQVADALDYKVVTKAVIDLVENGRFLLLEKLVADILAVCSEHPDVTYSRVTVDKPHALRFADSVSLTLDYRPEQAGSMRLLEKAS